MTSDHRQCGAKTENREPADVISFADRRMRKALRLPIPRYKAEFCNQVVELGKDGYGPEDHAEELGVDRITLDAWANKHPEFRAALDCALDLEQAYFEIEFNDKDSDWPNWPSPKLSRFGNFVGVRAHKHRLKKVQA